MRPTDGPCHSLVHTRLGHVSACAHQSWELERGDLRENLERRLPLSARSQPERMGGRKSANGNACGANPVYCRSKVPLLSDVQGWSSHCSLSLPTCRLLPPRVLGKPPSGLAFLCLLLGTRIGPGQGWPSGISHQTLGKPASTTDPLTRPPGSRKIPS